MRNRGGSRRLRAITAAVALALLSGGLLVACGDVPRSADDALASAEAVVSDATSFRFDATTRTTFVTGTGDLYADLEADPSSGTDLPLEGPGTTTIDRTTTAGAWTPEAWESRTDGSFGRAETKVFGTTGFFRFPGDGGSGEWQTSDVPAFSREELVDQLASMQDQMDEFDDLGQLGGSEEDGAITAFIEAPGAATSMAASIYLGGHSWGGNDLVSDPSGFLRAIEGLSDPQLASSDGEAVTVTARLSAPEDIEAAWGGPLPAGTVTLTIEGDGTPSRLVLVVGEGDDSVEIDLRFSEWNVPQEISRPGEDEIDRTPWIDEEALLAVPVTLVRPTALPEGWQLDYVDVLSSDDSGETCDQVELHWSSVVADDVTAELSDDYLDLSLVPVACATHDDSTPFALGRFGSLPGRDGAFGPEVLVGETVVQVDGLVSGVGLDALAASIAPTDVEALGEEMTATSGFVFTS